MSLERRVFQLEKNLENRACLPVMVWYEGRRNEALARYFKEHGRKPKTEIEICLVAPKLSRG